MTKSLDSISGDLTGSKPTTMALRDYIDCPHCKKKIQCTACAKDEDVGNCKSPRKRSQSNLNSCTLKCRKCAVREGNDVEGRRLILEQHGKRIRELETELREEKEKHCKALDEAKKANDKALKKEQKEHRIAVKKANKKVVDRLNFLQLQPPNSGQMFVLEPEAVALAIHGNPWIWAHRHVLVAKSALFEKMLQNVKVEDGYKYLAIRDTTLQLMQAVVSFCYTGNIEFNDEISPEVVLPVSHKYGIQYLKELCDEELCKRMTADNIGKLIKLAKAYEAPKLKAQTMDYLKNNFDVMRETVFESV